MHIHHHHAAAAGAQPAEGTFRSPSPVVRGGIV